MNIKYRIKKYLLSLSMVILLPFFIFGLVQGGAIVYGFNGVFGGIMSVVAYCTCTVGHVISVGPPRSGRFHFVPGSQLFEYGQIHSSGVWVLGTYGGSSLCKKRVGLICVTIPHQGDIELVGTSR